MKLNAELDERNKKIGSESPRKKSMLPRARASAPRQRGTHPPPHCMTTSRTEGRLYEKSPMK